jgi:hypothetical protein
LIHYFFRILGPLRSRWIRCRSDSDRAIETAALGLFVREALP